ncbi:MAG: hypothetical protein IPM29_04985 [Planctomycetes bacterium]|nr:hypothetical protein [Planctomycetota bacterium]
MNQPTSSLRHGFTAIVCGLVIVAATASPLAAQSSVVFSDGDLPDSAWTLQSFVYGPGGTASARQITGGGAPGNYREVIADHAPSSSGFQSLIYTFHRLNRAYVPTVQGPLSSIDLQMHTRLFEVLGLDGFACGLALYQGGNIYGAGRFNTPEPNWTVKSLTGMQPQHFGRFDTATGTWDYNRRPDFSASAAPIYVGFHAATSHTVPIVQRRRNGFDNFIATLHQAPVPVTCSWAASSAQMYALVLDPSGPAVLITDQDAPWAGSPVPPGANLIVAPDGDRRVGHIGIRVTTGSHTIAAEARSVPWGAGRQLTLTDCNVTRIFAGGSLRVCLGSGQFAPLRSLYARVLLIGVGRGTGQISAAMTGFVPGLAPQVAAAAAPSTPPYPSQWRPFFDMSPYAVTPPGVSRLRLDVDLTLDRVGDSVWLPLSAKLTLDAVPYPEIALTESNLPLRGSRLLFDSDGGVARAGDLFALLLSAGRGPIPIGVRQLDLSPELVVLAGQTTLDNLGRGQIAVPVPNIPALLGIELYAAGVAIGPAGDVTAVSNTTGLLFQ